MPRTKNALNKPKFIGIKLSTLCENLQENMLIPVEINFAKAIQLGNTDIKFEEIKELTTAAKRDKLEAVEKIDFSVT